MITLHKSWHAVLEQELQKEYVTKLKEFLLLEKRTGRQVFPKDEDVFNAFSKTPFEDVKVVIMGQDPYHGVGQAHGLSFSVQNGVKTPPSLQNIYKELESDLGIPRASHGCLENWAKQGVLLLNATLTVRAHNPKSHYGVGWEKFTDAVIEKLVQREDPLVFILWGNSAKEKCETIISQVNHPHLVLSSAHPSPFSATKFFGTKPFSKANDFLQRSGKTPIDWRVDLT